MRKLQNDFERMIGMYTAPNGMVFKDYWAAMEYNRQEIQKELKKIFEKANKGICPKCKRVCLKSSVKDVYVCKSCMMAFTPKENDDECKNSN